VKNRRMQQPISGANRKRDTILLGLILVLLAGCLTFGVIPEAVGADPAVVSEHSHDAAAVARQLQLEGARLQLQGQLTEAIGKYRESLALHPNPRLESLVEQLVIQAEKTAKAATVPPASPQQAPASAAQANVPASAGPIPAQAAPADVLPEQGAAQATVGQAVPGQGEGDAPASVKTEEGPAVGPRATVERVAGTPEEALIYAFTDWLLGLFPAAGQQQDFSLRTNRDYRVVQVAGQHEVRLDPCTLLLGDQEAVELGPVVLRFQPKGGETLTVTMRLPDKAPLVESGKTVAELSIGRQEIAGVWNRSLANFDRIEMQLGNLILEDVAKTGRLSLANLMLAGGSTQGEGGSWSENLRGEMGKLSFVDNGAEVAVDHLAFQADAQGNDQARFAELRQRIQQAMGRTEQMALPEIKELFANIEEYLRLLNASASSMAIKDIRVTSKQSTFSLDTVNLAATLHKEGGTGKMVYTSKSDGSALQFAETQTPEKPQPVSLSLGRIALTGEGSLHPIPPGLVSNLFVPIDGVEQGKAEQANALLAKHGLTVARKLLGLIDGYGCEVNISDLRLVNAQPSPVTLGQATVRGTFKAGTGEGGLLQALGEFSELKGIAQEAGNVPESARLRLELNKIPSLLNLINDPSALAAGNMQQVQGQIMMNGMNALLTSGLTLSLTDSFIAFPSARFTLGLLATVDQKAKYFSTGTLTAAVEQPDEFVRIVRSLSADPETEKVLATLTALADRRQEQGKTVDRIEARIDGEGKVFINTKDVTAMFFPPPSQPGQGTTPAPAQ